MNPAWCKASSAQYRAKQAIRKNKMLSGATSCASSALHLARTSSLVRSIRLFSHPLARRKTGDSTSATPNLPSIPINSHKHPVPLPQVCPRRARDRLRVTNAHPQRLTSAQHFISSPNIEDAVYGNLWEFMGRELTRSLVAAAHDHASSSHQQN